MAGKSVGTTGGTFRPARTVALIGPMAVGKSVVGAELARALHLEFIDTDHQITAKHGPIPGIFASHGEHHFRRLEARAVADVLDRRGDQVCVLSLGGGAVLDSGTQQLLARATVVYLRAGLETVRERITRTTGRPLLAEDPVAAWQRLAAARAPVYERLADITVDVDDSDIHQVVNRLIGLLGPDAGAATD
ncbi:shikimate kinase [Specibacter cremeus]|uniref:shikimate kinase n=1 Tax=Specibacter cremeus TaxID=1629051 RepID=UPI000F767767|nr:shikimate kinase [Specibacter cremeus]